MAEHTCRIDFTDRVVLVTGGARGLGFAKARLLARSGAKLVIADNGTAMDGQADQPDAAEEAAARITTESGTAVSLSVDLGTEAGASRTVAACLEAFGRIDAIAHYASPCPDPAPAAELATADMELAMRVNAYAAAWLARAAWPHMQQQRFGRLLFVPSAALYGSFGGAAYAMAKSAYIGLINCLAVEGRPDNIFVNGISPAARSRMTERFHDSAYARWFLEVMQAEHVASVGGYLLSDACSLNGEIIAAGGGRIGRIQIAENEGLTKVQPNIAAAAKAMPSVMADQRHFYPADLSERSAKVAAIMGFDGGLANDGKPLVTSAAKDE